MSTFNRSGTRMHSAIVLLLCSLTSAAFADSGDLKKSDQLFRNGKQFLAEEDYVRACPLLAESFRLDAATGTLLALAFCHEREGKLGSAFREYNQVIARCKEEARPDRAQAARERALALEARLSTLTIKTSNVSEVGDLEVRVNGVRIERARLDRALALDGGSQKIEVSAQGKKPWRTELRVAKSIDSKTVIIPALEDASPRPTSQPDPAPVAPPVTLAPLAPAPEPRTAPTPARRAVDDAPGLSPTQWVGLGTIGAGVIGLGAGTIFAVRAIGLNHDSNKDCIGDVCTATARQQRLDARTAGNAATIAFVAGAGLAVAGVSMYLLGQRSTSSADTRLAVSVAPWAAPRTLGGSVQGSF